MKTSFYENCVGLYPDGIRKKIGKMQFTLFEKIYDVEIFENVEKSRVVRIEYRYCALGWVTYVWRKKGSQVFFYF